VKINISEIATENVLSEVKFAAANEVVGGGGSTINFDFGIADGGVGAANANIKFDFQAQTQDIDSPENHSALLVGSLKVGD
jgi:hypothetical protein